ncbi:neuromedin U [Synechococcus sp. 1G10]|uniref:neuromedin U n=1 Tax=Synechococcus sp. 1G10 TaxID=2025605 RepID=UPI001181452F|nr:neuromedin U [Synechococcus sp. 1G10]
MPVHAQATFLTPQSSVTQPIGKRDQQTGQACFAPHARLAASGPKSNRDGADHKRMKYKANYSACDLLPDELKSTGFLSVSKDELLSNGSHLIADGDLQASPDSKATTQINYFSDPLYSDSDSVLARKNQNPIANMISVPFQNNINLGSGLLEKAQNVMLIQPIIPISISNDVVLITRTIVPVIYQPPFSETDSNRFGLGDIQPQFYFSPKRASSINWGFGPTFVAPTATSRSLGQGKWSIGPAAIFTAVVDRFVFGGVANNVWSVGGDSNRLEVSQLTIQPFVNYNLNSGWYLTSSPIVQANFMADKGNQWLVPVGGGIGRVFGIGGQKVNAIAQGFVNVVKPDNAPDWTLRFEIRLLFPKR